MLGAFYNFTTPHVIVPTLVVKMLLLPMLKFKVIFTLPLDTLMSLMLILTLLKSIFTVLLARTTVVVFFWASLLRRLDFRKRYFALRNSLLPLRISLLNALFSTRVNPPLRSTFLALRIALFHALIS